MFTHILRGIAVAAFAATFACAPAPLAPDPAKLVEGAKKLDEQFLEAFNARNVDAMTALYWNNDEVASFQPDLMVAHGPAAVRTYFERAMPAMPPGAKLEILEAHYVPVGDVVMAWGLYRFTVPGPDGKTDATLGRFSDVKAERDGKWVYLMDHGSVPMGPPPPITK